MKSGYDQFFNKAQKVASTNAGKNISSPDGKRRLQKKQVNQSPSTDAELIKQLRSKLVENKIKQNKKKPVPWKMIMVSFVGTIMAALGYLNLPEVEKVVSSIEISALGSAKAETAPAGEAANQKKDEAAKTDSVTGDTKKVYTDEELDHFTKLNQRKNELDSREEELNRMETELQAQRAELEKRLSELEQTRKNISSILNDRVEADDKKVESLVQMYSNMKPQQAAKVFESMDEALAVEIIGRMKKKNAAEVMNLIKADKAQMLTEMLAGYRRAPASTTESNK